MNECIGCARRQNGSDDDDDDGSQATMPYWMLFV